MRLNIPAQKVVKYKGSKKSMEDVQNYDYQSRY